MTTSPIGYRMFYAPNTLSPVPVATTPNQAAHVMVPTVGVPYATAQPSMQLAEGAEGTSMILEQAAPQMQFGHAGAGYAASVSSGDSAAAGFSGSSLVTATVSEGEGIFFRSTQCNEFLFRSVRLEQQRRWSLVVKFWI